MPSWETRLANQDDKVSAAKAYAETARAGYLPARDLPYQITTSALPYCHTVLYDGEPVGFVNVSSSAIPPLISLLLVRRDLLSSADRRMAVRYLFAACGRFWLMQGWTSLQCAVHRCNKGMIELMREYGGTVKVVLPEAVTIEFPDIPMSLAQLVAEGI